MKTILFYPIKLVFLLLKIYAQGLGKTIVIIVAIGVITLLYSITEPTNQFLERVIPDQYHFAQMGIVFILVVLPVLMLLLTKLGLFNFFNYLFKKVPFLNFVFREKGAQEGIPVAVKEASGLVYGFLRGRSIIYDDTDLVENGCIWWSVFIPSSPLPATSLKPKDVRPEDVREVEIIGHEGRDFARAAIIRKCINLGESLGNIRLKLIAEAEVEQLPVLSDKDKEEIADQIKKETKSAD